MNTHEQQFYDAIKASGIKPPTEIIADGKLHRFSTNGSARDDAGWFVLHVDGLPAGAFGCFRSGISDTWCAQNGHELTPAEKARFRERIADAQRKRESDEKKRHAEAAAEASNIYRSAKPASHDHKYLLSKGVKCHGGVFTNEKSVEFKGQHIRANTLLVPLRDASDTFQSLQIIPEVGKKLFLIDSRTKGCHFLIGEPTATICIAEGYATAATIHEATGYPVVVAFYSGNLVEVSKLFRERFPDAQLVLCADDDWARQGNPGLTKAKEAARAVGARLVLPQFGPGRGEKDTDFNDMARMCGVEPVKAIFEQALTETAVPAVPAVPTGKCSNKISEIALPIPGTADGTAAVPAVPDDKEQQDEAKDEGEGTDGLQTFPKSETGRPCFRVFGKWLEIDGFGKVRPGVWFFGIKPGKGEEGPTLTQQWVCSPLHIDAVTFDDQENNFGRLLTFRNTLGHERQWAMPMELLKGSGEELRGELLSMGVKIDPGAKQLLSQYLQSGDPKRRMHCTLQVGWCDNSYVLPDTVIGTNSANIIFQSGERLHEEYTKKGTLIGWQSEIAARAVENPLLTLTISSAFAGPLLEKCNAEGGGIHLVGDSSTGKTTMIEVACSVWGGPNFRRSWRATANGMEGAAALFNDCLLALDEISECHPKEIGAIVYALGNGRGKQRASRAGYARSVTRWRCFIISSGERTIATHMLEGGLRAKAGQSVRLLDIPSARKFGAFDSLHGFANGAALSDALKRAAATHYGHAGRAFLERLTRDDRDFCSILESYKAVKEFSAHGSAGQEKRAAARFALIGLAGELAAQYGIVSWEQGAAAKAAIAGFQAWLSHRGTGNDEPRQILDQLSSFIERHGDGRFSAADGSGETLIRDRAGWWEVNSASSSRSYLFTKDGLREALSGFDFKRALQVLEQAGILPPPNKEGRSKSRRIGNRKVRLYQVDTEKLEADTTDAD